MATPYHLASAVVELGCSWLPLIRGVVAIRHLSHLILEPVMYVVPKVHKVYRVEEVEEEKERRKTEAKSRPELEEFI